jgi:hypothetical protein
VTSPTRVDSSTEARGASLGASVGVSLGARLRRVTRRLVWALSLGCVAASAGLQAQPVVPAGTVNAASQGSDDADDQRWRLTRCLLGLSYGSPLKLSVAAAGGLRRAFTHRSVCSYGAVHLGLGGTRASLGTAVTFGRFGSALGVSGGVLRTFGAPAGDALRFRTYTGASVHLWPILGVHTEIGRYRLLTRDGEASQQLTTWSVGFGY